MLTAAVITVSDKGYQGTREDLAGPAVKALLEAHDYQVADSCIVPDEHDLIKNAMIKYADEQKIDLIVTTGGTGFSPRDITPEVTIEVCERMAPGIPEVMRYESYQITPRAMLSRAAAGIRKQSLIINLPGSPKAAKENLIAVLPHIGHGIEILKQYANECGVAE